MAKRKSKKKKIPLVMKADDSMPWGVHALDADEIVNMKMEQNEKKYPVEKAKGSANKWDRL